MLEREGRVRFERNRGVRVLAPTAHDIAEVFELRLLLEVPTTASHAAAVDLDELAATFAAMSAAADANDEAAFMDADERFHAVVLSASGNRRLLAAVAQLRDAVRGRGASTVGRSRALPEILGEHRAILEGLQAGDPDRAAAAMRYHLRRTGDLLVAQEGATRA
jgi:DNA-binding GntR family transcriptional regulator